MALIEPTTIMMLSFSSEYILDYNGY